MTGFRITFSSGYFITCWAGVCAANSQNDAPAFRDVFADDTTSYQGAWGSCLEIKTAMSERVTAVRVGDYTNGQSDGTSNTGELITTCARLFGAWFSCVA